MIPSNCPKCDLSQNDAKLCSKIQRYGQYYRTSDSSWVQRFRCGHCQKTFSASTLEHSYRQKKRQKNPMVVKMLCAGVTMRRIAKDLNIHPITVNNIFLIEARKARDRLDAQEYSPRKCSVLQFDDLETFEHTKCKPLSVTLAVEEGTRRILATEVSVMAANGKLAKRSRNKYGRRKDGRRNGRKKLFARIQKFVEPNAVIKSDQNPYYPALVKEFFPAATHITYKGRRGSDTGQGEIKKVVFDPIFSLNHTCAMLRANINRLIRKTWSTTKRLDRLQAHLDLYADRHNSHFIPKIL